MTGWTGKHGFSAYANGACRCDICTESANEYQGDRRARRYRTTQTSGLPSHVLHGQSAYVNWGCRCEICSAAQAAKNAAGKARRKKAREAAA